MISSYLNYRLYTQDLSQTLERTAAEPQVYRDSGHDRDSIPSVDELINDCRLYSDAMRPYGLEDMIYAERL